MKILIPDNATIRKAADIIKSGGLVAFPTETVYGLGANALDPIAVTKIFEAKERPFFDPLIVHIADKDDITKLTTSRDPKVEQLIHTFWPGPLTIVVEKTDIVPGIITSGLDTVAIRMPQHPTALDLIKAAGTPIAAPSANPFGYLSPTTAEHVHKQLGNRIELILDGGRCKVGVESTIIKVTSEKIVLLRPGGTPVEEIEKITGPVEIINKQSRQPDAPGQLPFHYSPVTPVTLVETIDQRLIENKQAGFIFFKKPSFPYKTHTSEILSETGELHEAAANLFNCMHRLDKLSLNMIYAEVVPEEGLGLAIMDRLNKASKRYEETD